MEWLAPVSGLLGVVIGLGYSQLARWQERKERFQVMTFEKRLEAYQKAYYWCYSLHSSIGINIATVTHRIADEALEWCKSSCLYLDEETRKEMYGVINGSFRYHGVDEATKREILNQFDTAYDAIRSGIGREYLPKVKDKLSELK